MKMVGWQLTNNQKTDKDFKEYDKVTYQCINDDIWVTTETPVENKTS